VHFLQLDLGTVWASDGHTIVRQWIALTTKTKDDEPRQIGGYVCVTAAIFSAGEEPSQPLHGLGFGRFPDDPMDILGSGSLQLSTLMVRIDCAHVELATGHGSRVAKEIKSGEEKLEFFVRYASKQDIETEPVTVLPITPEEQNKPRAGEWPIQRVSRRCVWGERIEVPLQLAAQRFGQPHTVQVGVRVPGVWERTRGEGRSVG
jgi:hypothetical protein